MPAGETHTPGVYGGPEASCRIGPDFEMLRRPSNPSVARIATQPPETFEPHDRYLITLTSSQRADVLN
jgi:hypothetical protein